MKRTKILFLAAIILAVGGAIGYHSYQKNQEPELSKLAIANIEALTQSEKNPEWYDFINNYIIKERISLNSSNCKNGTITFKGFTFSASSCTNYSGAEIHHCYDGGKRDECTSSKVAFYY